METKSVAEMLMALGHTTHLSNSQGPHLFPHISTASRQAPFITQKCEFPSTHSFLRAIFELIWKPPRQVKGLPSGKKEARATRVLQKRQMCSTRKSLYINQTGIYQCCCSRSHISIQGWKFSMNMLYVLTQSKDHRVRNSLGLPLPITIICIILGTREIQGHCREEQRKEMPTMVNSSSELVSTWPENKLTLKYLMLQI